MGGPALTQTLRPLRDREFRLLVTATLISVLGDGLMRVALPLLVLAITDNDPLAISFVGLAWMVGHAASLPIGGVASDRRDRRSIMIASDLIRAMAIGCMGLLGILGVLQLWQMVALGFSFGFANGFFNPSARSLTPDLVPEDDLAPANALLGFARPMQLWIVGPLLGGVLVGTAGPGTALVVDAATFVVSALVLARLPRRDPAVSGETRSIGRDLREGLSYVGSHRWAAIWFTASALATLAFHGTFDVLVPTMLKTDLGLNEAQAGWWMAMIFAAGGVGALLASSTIGRGGLPRRFMLQLYIAESLTLLGLAAFAYVSRLWHVLLVGLLVFGATVMSEIIAETNLQREVPRALLGRVISLSWFVAIGVAPISFALAGPLGRIYGPRPVLVAVGVFAGVTVLALSLAPGARSPEWRRRPRDRAAADHVAPTEPVIAGELAQADRGVAGGVG